MEYYRVVAIHINDATDNAPVTRAARDAWSLMQKIVFSQRPNFMAVMRDFDLIPPHFIALQALDEPRPMGAIAKQLACDSSNVTWITDRLEERGLVERRPAEYDRRVKLLALTPKGRKVRDEVEARLALPPTALAALPPSRQETLRDLLAEVAEGLEPR
jgi:DNA-binding MarR family transcriptional regulator